MLEVGDTYKNYRIVGTLGKGGMSVVYLVRDEKLGALWALKVQSKQRKPNESETVYNDRMRNVLNEAQLLSQFRNSSIPRVTDIDQDSENIYILQDYVEGVSLKEQLDSLKHYRMKQYLEEHPNENKKTLSTKYRFRQLPKSEYLAIAKKVAKILLYLHQLNPPVIYRDLKPDNLMIDKEGNLKLIDFGIAYQWTEEVRKPGAKAAMGTWGYCAPEQIGSASNPTPQTDIFNFGRFFYELISGIVLSSLPDAKAHKKVVTLPKIREVRPDIDEGIEVILDKCMRINPKERYQDFNEVLYDLDHYYELGSTYREKIKHRLQKVGLLATLSGAFLISGVGATIYSQMLEKDAYQSMLSQASMYKNIDDILPIITNNPKETKPVERLVELYEEDGKFTLKEEEQMIGVLSENITDLKKNNEYGNLAYKIGELYLFYYNPTDDATENNRLRMAQASQWFKDASTSRSDKADLANIFYHLGEFNRDLPVAKRTYDDGGMYRDYFSLLQSLESAIKDPATSNFTKVKIPQIVGDNINDYYHDLINDGVSVDDMRELLKVNREQLKANEKAIENKAGIQPLISQAYHSLDKADNTIAENNEGGK